MTHDSDTIVFVLATLSDATEIEVAQASIIMSVAHCRLQALLP
jgi:hypothetical protein